MKNKLTILLATLLFPLLSRAQNIEAPQMADTFRSEGKIYVVISVLAIIFTCIVAYLIYIDIKVRKLENKK